jgi:lysophospholipase L1-like esterase
MEKPEAGVKSSNDDEHKPPIKIACVGDSLTYGFGASSSSHNYPANLQNLLGDKFVVRDYGVDGVTAQKKPHTREGSYWDKKFFRKSHDFLPDVVLIMLGTNDSKEPNWNAKKFESDLRDLVHTYKVLDSRPDVYLMTPPRALPTKQCKMMKIERDVIETKIPEIMQRISHEEKTHLIHLTNIFLFDKEHLMLF